jgi:hypothetical protein
MTMLLQKAWLETRIRFFAGLCAVALVCTFYLQQHAWLTTWWASELRDPHGYHFPWMPIAVREYGWYLWHFLYENYLQQVWALFAVVFAFGGLAREKALGNAVFSLGLPVSRRRWLFTRLGVAGMQSAALALFAVVYVAVGSRFIHQICPVGEMLAHSMLMVVAGVVLIAVGNMLYELFPGGYLSLLATLVLLGAPYFLLQSVLEKLKDAGRSSWLQSFDLAHAMAGPWKLTWTTVPWLSLCVVWGCTALFLLISVVYGDRVDY